QLRRDDRLIQSLELLRPGDGVIADVDRQLYMWLGLGAHSPGEGQATTRLQRLEAALEGITAGEGQPRIDSSRGELACARDDVALAAVDHHVRSQALHEAHTILARGGRENAR